MTVSYLNATHDKLQGICAADSDFTGVSIYHNDSFDTIKCIGNETETYHYSVRRDNIDALAHFGRSQLPHVMTTKNNLDTPVTKTSGQTMKVTYVLTETT
jgi:hypothetical protein